MRNRFLEPPQQLLQWVIEEQASSRGQMVPIRKNHRPIQGTGAALMQPWAENRKGIKEMEIPVARRQFLQSLGDGLTALQQYGTGDHLSSWTGGILKGPKPLHGTDRCWQHASFCLRREDGQGGEDDHIHSLGRYRGGKGRKPIQPLGKSGCWLYGTPLIIKRLVIDLLEERMKHIVYEEIFNPV